LEIDPAQVGLNASPTKVFRTFTPAPKGAGKRLEGSPKQQVAALLAELRSRKVTWGGGK
jgi:electron transfer flavoprotein beta subunit